MTDALVISGSGPYADRWHSFPDTSARIARIIADLGYTVTFSDDVEHTLAYPGPCRLLVVNIGNPSTPRPAEAIDAVRSGRCRTTWPGAAHCLASTSAPHR